MVCRACSRDYNSSAPEQRAAYFTLNGHLFWPIFSPKQAYFGRFGLKIAAVSCEICRQRYARGGKRTIEATAITSNLSESASLGDGRCTKNDMYLMLMLKPD